MQIERTCVACGKKFFVYPSRLKRGDKCIYCSQECQGKARRRKYYVENKEFKVAYEKFLPLMLWKAREVARGNVEIKEELLQRFSISLYKNLARKGELKSWEQGFRVSVNYECCKLWKDMDKIKKEVPCGVLYRNQNSTSFSLDDKLDMRALLRRVEGHLAKPKFKVYRMYLAGGSYENLAKVCGTSTKAIQSRIERKRKLLKRDCGVIAEVKRYEI